MKTYSLAALLLAVPLTAQQPTTPQQQTGHVLSAADTEIQVGNLIYACPRVHKEVQVGKDYPVTIETDKHGSPKKIDVVVAEKTYTYHITGTREAKAN